MTEHKGKTALDEIMAGLDGVTPGAWSKQKMLSAKFEMGQHWVIGNGDAIVTFSPIVNAHDPEDQESARIDAAHIARCSPHTIRDIAAYAAVMREALEKIVVGDGVYGAQAFEYMQIARAALQRGEGTNDG